jgi:hypothetical protein
MMKDARGRTGVLIFYCQKDQRWLEELEGHLKPLSRADSITAWSDQQIGPARSWRDEIKAALASAKVVILLVTPNFIASRFIYTADFMLLLKEAERDGARILLVVTRLSAYEQSPLRDYQPVSDPTKPLAALRKAERDRVWTHISRIIATAAVDDADRKGERPSAVAAGRDMRQPEQERLRAAREPPQEAAVEARQPSRVTPPLYWNTRFPEDPAVHDTRTLLVRRTYVVETIVEPHTGPRDFDSAPAGMERLFGPGEKTMDVVFCVEGEGLQARRAGRGADDFGASVRSEPLPCSLRDGSRPFRVEVRGPHEGAATLLLSLLVRNAVVSRRRLEFRVTRAPASSFRGFRSPRISVPGPGPARMLVSDRSPHFAAVTPAEIRIRVSSSEDGGRRCRIEVEKDDRRSKPEDLEKEKSQLDALGWELRGRLDALSRSYDPEPAAPAEEFGLRLRAPESVLLEFARIGAELCEKLFGNMDNPPSLDLRKIAQAIATTPGGEGSRLQIDADYLPLPWAILYDARVHACALGQEDPECARHNLRFNELTTEAISARFFWGYRFAIDRLLRGNLLGPIRRQGQIQAFIHPGILRQMQPPPGDKQAAFFDTLQQTPSLRVDRKKTNNEFEAFLANRQMRRLDLLYLFCHAQRASSTSPRGAVLRGEEALKSACVLLDAPPDKLTLEEMWLKRGTPLPGAPLVFLNACASAAGDPEFQSPFLDLFMDKYGARGYVGTDWEVPAVFADAFARRVLHRYVVEDVPLGLAFHRTTREVLENYGNPFGLIYCLYASPGLRFSQGE